MIKIYTLFVILFTLNVFSQSGNLDTSFGNNGKIHTGFGVSNSIANSVAVQPDGKIIAGGSAYTANTVNSWETDTNNATLIRYNTNGTIDTTFGNDGIVMNDFYTFNRASNWNSGILCIKLQSDGKILTYEFGSQNYTSVTVLSRYNSDGSPDSSFGNNGRIGCNSSPISGNNPLVIQPDGKILVLGVQNLNPSPGVYSSQFVVERYNTDGSIDNAFATNGRVATAFGSSYDIPKALALQTDGKIVAVGFTTGTTNPKFAIARYTINGDLDTTFGSDGKVLTSFGTGINCFANFVTLHPDGKILVTGTTTGIDGTDFALAKYNANGSLDTSFDGDGKATNAFDTSDNSSEINSVFEQSDGKFVITTTAYVGGAYDQADDLVTRRYNSDGTTDTSFGTNGKVTTTFQTGFNTGLNIAIQSDNRILVAGYSHPLSSAQNDFNVLRYQSNGTLDTTFNNNGKVTTKFDASNDNSTVMLLQPDGKLISIGVKSNLTGYPGTQDIAVSRYNNDGSPDTSFGNDGKVVSIFGRNINNINQAVLQADGKIVVSNIYTNPFVDNFRHFELVRYTANGSIDLTFGTEGKVALDAEINSVLSQPDGKIIITYTSYDSQNNTSIILKRFNNNGTLDNSFDNDGIASVTGTFYGSAKAAIQPNGKIVIAVSLSDINNVIGSLSLIRFNTNGSLDSGFDSTIAAFGDTSFTNAIFFQPDGKIIVAGRSTSLSGGYDFFQFVTARFNSDGSLDTTYGTDGMTTTYLGSYFEPYAIIQSVVLQPDGKFLVALSKAEQNPASPTPNSYDFVIYRFNANGGYDSDFGAEGKITTSFYNKYDEAFSMVLQPDNKIVVAGTTDTGINRDFAIARYDNTILSAKSFITNHDLFLYPNPANGIINIEFPVRNDLRVTKVEIYNMLGQMVYSEDKGSDKINVSNLQTGIYHLKATTNKGDWSGKFIKD